MDDKPDPRLDEQLRVLLSRTVEWPRDEGFSQAVMTRINRRARIRRTVLATAMAGGGVIAVAPAYELVAALGAGLAEVTTRWGQGDWRRGAWLAQHWTLAVAMACAVVTPLAARMMED